LVLLEHMRLQQPLLLLPLLRLTRDIKLGKIWLPVNRNDSEI